MVCAIFPSSPTLGQQHAVGNVTYEWDGQKWNSVTGPLSYSQLSGRYIDSIAATPDYVLQFAVVGGVVYVSTGVSSPADWKQITG